MPRPLLVAIGGLPGTGKSTLARLLARRLRARVVSSDAVRRESFPQAPRAVVERSRNPLRYDLQRAFLEQKIPARWQALIWKQIQQYYPLFLQQAGRELARGKRAVLDATFYQQRWRRAAQALARKHGARFLFVECRAPARVVRERMRARWGREQVSAARWSAYLKVKAAYEPLPRGFPAERVHAGRGVSDLKRRAEAIARGLKDEL